MFERLVSPMKQELYKVVGSAKLTFKELQDLMLDSKNCFYCEDKKKLPHGF